MPRRIESPRRAPEGGWILLEVLAALAVLSLSLAGLFQAFATAAAAARTAEQRLQEVLAAQSALEQPTEWTLVSPARPGVSPLYEVRATVGAVTLTTWRLGETPCRRRGRAGWGPAPASPAAVSRARLRARRKRGGSGAGGTTARCWRSSDPHRPSPACGRGGPAPLCPRNTRGSCGFTLLEVLVAAALFALVMLLAGGATSLALKGWREAGARAEQGRRLAAAHHLVRRLVSEAWPAADGQRVAFAGGPDRLRLVVLGPMGSGRQTAFELRLAGGTLEAVSAALDPADRAPFAALARGKSTVLLDRLAGGRFAYYGALQPGRPPAWHDVWADPVSLPLLVRLRLDVPSGDGRRWPEMVAAPKMESPVTF